MNDEMPEDQKAKRKEIQKRRLEKAIQPKGCGRGHVKREIWATQQKPDWDFWLIMPKVELWQACALSLNIEPDSIAPENDGMGGESFFKAEKFPDSEIWNKFNKRLRLLDAYIREQDECFPHAMELVTFIRLAMNFPHSWNMPPELVAPVQKLEEQNDVTLTKSLQVAIKKSDKDERRQVNNESSNKPNQNKQKRVHALHELITRVYKNLSKRNSNREVWNALKNKPEILDSEIRSEIEHIIQEMDKDCIYWITRQGKERRMLRETFNNYLSKLRNS